MAFPITYALTGAEFAVCDRLPEHCAWMACHYSCYGTGLSNQPEHLPAGSMLIVNDRTPPDRHDPGLIVRQLQQMAEQFQAEKILLDFQRRDIKENALVAKAVAEALPCPVGVSSDYARELDCCVFLPPPPLHIPLPDYLQPWQGREIWLEAALTSQVITVTPAGSVIDFLPFAPEIAEGFDEKTLHCRYRIEANTERGIFTLTRTKEHLLALLQEAETLGVTLSVGLYQELKTCFL